MPIGSYPYSQSIRNEIILSLKYFWVNVPLPTVAVAGTISPAMDCSSLPWCSQPIIKKLKNTTFFLEAGLGSGGGVGVGVYCVTMCPCPLKNKDKNKLAQALAMEQINTPHCQDACSKNGANRKTGGKRLHLETAWVFNTSKLCSTRWQS